METLEIFVLWVKPLLAAMNNQICILGTIQRDWKEKTLYGGRVINVDDNDEVDIKLSLMQVIMFGANIAKCN